MCVKCANKINYSTNYKFNDETEKTFCSCADVVQYNSYGGSADADAYYIRHNEYPEHVANFYIAQRVGAIQEEESQRGLAHFLEHMAFNGSEHFKGNGIIESSSPARWVLSSVAT